MVASLVEHGWRMPVWIAQLILRPWTSHASGAWHMLQGEPELMQHLFGVPRMLDALRAHYVTGPSPDAVQPAAGEHIL